MEILKDFVDFQDMCRANLKSVVKKDATKVLLDEIKTKLVALNEAFFGCFKVYIHRQRPGFIPALF